MLVEEVSAITSSVTSEVSGSQRSEDERAHEEEEEEDEDEDEENDEIEEELGDVDEDEREYFHPDDEEYEDDYEEGDGEEYSVEPEPTEATHESEVVTSNTATSAASVDPAPHEDTLTNLEDHDEEVQHVMHELLQLQLAALTSQNQELDLKFAELSDDVVAGSIDASKSESDNLHAQIEKAEDLNLEGSESAAVPCPVSMQSSVSLLGTEESESDETSAQVTATMHN